MKTNILDFIDFEKVNTLLEGFNQSTGFVTAILDLEGNVLSKSGWRQMCTEFHRVNPETSKKCTISDTELANKMGEGEKYHFYKCLNGLVDVAVPLIINGEHVANLFSGQFFFEEPDGTFFKKQAEKYGFDEGKYMAALKNVPVVSQEKVKTAMNFLLNMTQIISETAFQQLEQITHDKNLRESEERFNLAMKASNDGLFDWNLETNEIYYSPSWKKMLGYEDDELPNDFSVWEKTTEPEDVKKSWELQQKLITKQIDRFVMEFKMKHKDGYWVDILSRAQSVFNDSGKAVRIVGTHTNITERKRSEILLHEQTEEIAAQNKELNATNLKLIASISKAEESEKRFRKSIEFSPIPMAVTNNNGDILFLNKQFVEAFGYSIEELGSIPKWFELVYPDIEYRNSCLTQWGSDVEFAIKNSVPTPVREGFITCKNGVVKTVEISVSIENDISIGLFQDITERKQAEEVLREREYLLSSSQQAAHIGTWSWKIGDTSVYWSDETYRIYGLNPAMGAPSFEFFFEIIHPEDRPKMQEWPTLVIAGLHPPPIEFRVIRPDGIYRVIQTDGDVIETVDGVPSRIAGTAHDITERKQAEGALRQSEEKFSIMFRKAPFSAALSSISDLKLVEVNEQFEKYWGYSSAEVIGKTSTELGLYPDDNERARLSAIFREKGFIHDEETKMITKTGQLIVALVSSDIVNIGNEQFVLSTVQNITVRKKAEEALHKSEQLLSFSLEKSHIGGWELDLVNHTAHRTLKHDQIFGYDTLLPQWTYEMFLEHVLEVDRAEVNRSFGEATANHTDWSFECRICRKDGEVRWIWAAGGHQYDASGQARRLAGIVQDITERKNAEEEIKKQLDELQRWHQVILGREGRILELKKEVNDLLHQRGEPLRYGSTLPENTDVETKV